MAGNNTKMNISYTIRAIDKFSKTHQKLERQLNRIEGVIDNLPDSTHIKIEADTKEFTRKAKRAEQKLNSFPNRVKVHFQTNYKRFRRDIDRMADAVRDFDEVMGSMAMGSMLTFLPAVSSAATILAGGLGAVGSAATSAGLGAAGFAAVAIPSITKVVDAHKALKDAQDAVEEAANEEERAEALKDLEKLQSKYTDSQLKSVDAIRDFTKFFEQFQAKFEPDILNIFNDVLGTTKSLLTILEPAIAGVTGALGNLVESFDANLQADDMKAFFAWVGDTAGPNLEQLVGAVGNFLAGFANMMVAFDPLAQAFMDGFVNMSERFREWSSTLDENQAFQNFMTYVEENAPTLLSLIGNIITTLVNFGIAMEPVATKVLELADSFFAWTSELMKTSPWIAELIGVSTVAIGLFRIFYPLIETLKFVFMTLWPVITTVSTWFGKLVGVIKSKAIPILGRIGSVILRFIGGPIGLLIQGVALLAFEIFRNWDEIWTKTQEIWSKISGWMIEKLEKALAKIDSVRQFVSDFLGKFGELGEGISDKMDGIFDTVEGAINNLLAFLRGDLGWKEIGANMISGLMTGIGSMASSLVDKAKGVVGGAIEGAKNLLGIKSPSRVFKEIGVFTGQGFIIGMDNMESRVTKASERMSKASVPNVQSPNYQGVSVATAPNYGFRDRGNTDTSDSNKSQSITQNLHFYGDAASTPSATARKNKQALRDWAMEANF